MLWTVGVLVCLQMLMEQMLVHVLMQWWSQKEERLRSQSLEQVPLLQYDAGSGQHSVLHPYPGPRLAMPLHCTKLFTEVFSFN